VNHRLLLKASPIPSRYPLQYRIGDIWKVDIAARYILIPRNMEWSLHQAQRILFIDTAAVYPEVLQSSEAPDSRRMYLLPPATLPYAGFCVLKANFLLSPGVREYCVVRISPCRFVKRQSRHRVSAQETYVSHGRGSRAILGQARLVRLVQHIGAKSAIQRSTEWNQMSKDWSREVCWS